MSNYGQPAIPSICNSREVSDAIHILEVELDGSDGLLVTFSDGTSDGYVVEELLELRPIREKIKIKKIKDHSVDRASCENSSTRPSGPYRTPASIL